MGENAQAASNLLLKFHLSQSITCPGTTQIAYDTLITYNVVVKLVEVCGLILLLLSLEDLARLLLLPRAHLCHLLWSCKHICWAVAAHTHVPVMPYITA
jgi:hypothetical protein